jgi:hypothetical protein
MGLGLPSGRSVVAAALLAALAACGDGDSDSDPPVLGGGGDIREDFTAMQDRLDQLFNTSFTPPDNAIPTSGTAEFRGFMKVDVAGTDPIDLTGTARITADFGAGTLVGSAQDFEGLEGNRVSDYAGTVTFVDGRVGRSPVPQAGEQPNDVRLGYQGSLNGAGNLVTLDGAAFGKLKGSPIQGLVAASAPGETVTVGATQVGATVTIVAETP